MDPGVVRDFIPDGKKRTKREEQRLGEPPWTRSGAEPKTATKPDFRPGPGHQSPGSDPDAASERAHAAAERAQARDAQVAFERARDHLRKLDAREAIEVIRVLSGFERDMYLTVEKFDTARKDILSAFPAPDPSFERRVPSVRARDWPTKASKE